jgi:hypothetical protein
MQFEGQGGAVGFGKGTATVTLKEAPEGTELSYEAKAQIGGKLAQVGSRLIDSVAKKMADDFFKAFQTQLSPPVNMASTTAAAALALPSSANPSASAKTSVSPAKRLEETSDQAKVPAWWLFPAATLGAALMLVGSRWMH